MKKSSKILSIFLGIFLIAFAVGVLAQDITPPIVFVIAKPSEVTTTWQNTEAFAYVSCLDEESGCDKASYKLKIYDSDPEICSNNYDEYTFCKKKTSCDDKNAQTISSHQWVCGAAKDLAGNGNIGFSKPLEFKVDTTFPTGTIDASPKEVRANEIFNITVSGEDNIDMGVVCYKEENDIDWTCYTCAGASASCNYSFKRSELALGKYKYYGYVVDFVGNGSFTSQEFVIVETDPLAATVSVFDFQATRATLKGYLIDMGKAESVKVWFQWGTTTDYGNETEYISKNTTGSFTATITDLVPGIVYHFRAVARNGVGTASGDDMVTTELITNGGFETGNLIGWSKTTLGYYKAATEDVYKGVYSGLFGFKEGLNKPKGESAFYQDVSIPSAAKNVELSFAYKFYTTDKCDYDFINIYLKDTSDRILKTYLEWCCRDCSGLNTYGWNEITADLTGFAGQTVRIWFEVENGADQWHRSWAYIDEVSIKYIPISLSSVTTKPATGIKPSEAVLNGELTDTGGAGSVEVWFVWDFIPHDKWQDYPNKTESVSQTSIGPFSELLGNLSSGKTYHFRAVAKNSAGTSSGANLEFTTLYAAAGGWICPPKHEDPSNHWSYEERAHDCDVLTRAHDGPAGIGWKGFIIFDLVHAVRSNKIRVSATGKGCPDPPCPISDIDILYQGASTWTNLYQAELPLNHNWVEIPLPSEGMVIKGRFRFYYQKAGWISTLDEFQFYKVPDEPITPPAGNTLEATSIEENSVILHGQVIDDGRELCQIRFQYGKTPDYGINTPWETGPGGVGFASGETFGKFISGLEKGVTYHFRAQIKNGAGIASGADKTFFSQSALSGWISPQGAYGDKWEGTHFVFDDELRTYARRLRVYNEGQWSTWFYFTRPEIYSDKIRFWAHEPYEIDSVQVDVFRNGSWITVYSGLFPDSKWVEASFAGGRVSQARIKFHMTYSSHYFYYLVHEFDFWKIAQAPSVFTVATEAADIRANQATLKGKLTDMGGAQSVDVWFIWDTSYHDKWQDYAYSSYAERENMTQPGDFERTILDLSSATTYHFRAVASNVAGTSSGQDREFTTLGECVSGEIIDCISEQGCNTTTTCSQEGTYTCPRHECLKNTEDSPDCLCPDHPEDGCVNSDYYEYPDYGNCTDSCICNIGTDLGQPCAPIIYPNDPRCVKNAPPIAAFRCVPGNCAAYSGSAKPTLRLINESTDSDGLDDIVQSEWDILDHSGDELICTGRCDYAVQSTLLAPGDYEVQLKVIDTAGASDVASGAIDIKKDAIANFVCSLYQDGPWQDCLDFRGIQKEYTYFKDTSTVSEGASFVRSRIWKLNETTFDSGIGYDPVATSSAELTSRFNTVELTIIDNEDREDTTSYTFGAKLPLPTWREIAP